MSSEWSLGTFDHSSLPSPSAPPSKVTTPGKVSCPSSPLSLLLFFYHNQLHHNKLFAKGLVEDIFEQTTQLPRHCLLELHRAPNSSPPLWSHTSLSNKAVSKVRHPLLLGHDHSRFNCYSRPVQVNLARTTTFIAKPFSQLWLIHQIQADKCSEITDYRPPCHPLSR